MRTVVRSPILTIVGSSPGVASRAQVGDNVGLLNPNLAAADELSAVARLERYVEIR